MDRVSRDQLRSTGSCDPSFLSGDPRPQTGAQEALKRQERAPRKPRLTSRSSLNSCTRSSETVAAASQRRKRLGLDDDDDDDDGARSRSRSRSVARRYCRRSNYSASICFKGREGSVSQSVRPSGVDRVRSSSRRQKCSEWTAGWRGGGKQEQAKQPRRTTDSCPLSSSTVPASLPPIVLVILILLLVVICISTWFDSAHRGSKRSSDLSSTKT